MQLLRNFLEKNFLGLSKFRKTMTWKPEPNMTAKQIEKEVQRQATLFEERCLKKLLPSRQRFFHFIQKSTAASQKASGRRKINQPKSRRKSL